ncbi:DUF6889 family protein [Pseudomonas sp. NPDC098747]|uniref:DUF6889 family protein n=1 Tax=Pseudomonas sp. NPDC098747 TaxID=3364487 RepID=UPI00383A0D68
MPDGEDWLLLPVHEGMCRYESLKDGTLDLADIAKMNDSLLVRAENKHRVQVAQEAANG